MLTPEIVPSTSRTRDDGLSFASARAFMLDEYVGLPSAASVSFGLASLDARWWF